jgi:hypothetical protein
MNYYNNYSQKSLPYKKPKAVEAPSPSILIHSYQYTIKKGLASWECRPSSGYGRQAALANAAWFFENGPQGELPVELLGAALDVAHKGRKGKQSQIRMALK